jgi:hypothetical protein
MRGPFRPKAPARPSNRPLTRIEAIRRTTRSLQRHAWPRMEMFLIVSVTGLAGFFASVVLLQLGFEQMAQRYPLAVGIAYLVFLFQLWIWIHTRGGDSDPGIDSIDVSRSGHSSPDPDLGHGGDFGGGGASGSWEASEAGPLDSVASSLDSVDVVGDGEGCVAGIILLVAIVVAGGLLFAAINLVWGAPVLLAELLVDGALTFGLYRNLRRQERDFWLFTAVRRTALVFAAVALFLLAAGALLERRFPGTHSFGEAMRASKSEAVK